jgi:putative hydrolase of the HAD superfamily
MRDRPLVAFDAMGVIFIDSDDVSACLIPFIRNKGSRLPEEEVLALYREASLGRLSAADLWEALGLGGEYPDIETEYLAGSLRLDPLFKDTALELGAWADLGLFSNDLAEWSAGLRAIHSLESLFSCVLVSGEAGLRKPDPRACRLFIERAGQPATSIVFIDDRPANLEAAAEAGMRTILFRREGAPGHRAGAGIICYDAIISGMPEVPAAAARILGRLAERSSP